MEMYEHFLETARVVLRMDDTEINRAIVENQKSIGTEAFNNDMYIATLCKEHDLSYSGALMLCVKAEFEAFAAQELSNRFDMFGMELYHLAETAGRFELFSPGIDKACSHVATAYGIAPGIVSACSMNIIHNRFYLYDGTFLKESLDTLLRERADLNPQHDAEKSKNQLREKIALEKSCEIKSMQLLEAKAVAMEIRSQFLSRFPAYLKEFVVKIKADVLKAIDAQLSAGKKISEQFSRTQAGLLCERAGIEREMKSELSAGRFERFACRLPADQEMANYFHREVTGEIMTLLKYAHPDKWNTKDSGDDLQKQIAEKSRQLIRFKELSRLGPGVMTFHLMHELQSWKKEFALLNPEAAEDAFRKKKNHPIDKEILFWEASEKYLSEELESFMTDKELANMRVIMDAPDMYEEYDLSIGNSIVALTHCVEQLISDPSVKQQWSAILEHAKKMAGNPKVIGDLYN